MCSGTLPGDQPQNISWEANTVEFRRGSGLQLSKMQVAIYSCRIRSSKSTQLECSKGIITGKRYLKMDSEFSMDAQVPSDY